MSFTDMDGILSLGEDLMCAAFNQQGVVGAVHISCFPAFLL
jgi:hypothetical protein